MQRLFLIADELPVLLSYIDRDTRYHFANRAYERWFGRRREEILGRTMREVLGDAAFETLRPHVEKVLGGQPVSYQAQVAYHTGGHRFIEATYVPHREDGVVVGFAVMVADISERKRLEQERTELLAREQSARAEAEAQRNNLHALFMQAPAAIAILRGQELRYELSNPLNQTLSGGRIELGKTVREVMPELAADGLFTITDQVLRTGEPFVGREVPVTLVDDHGQPRRAYLNGTYQPLRGPEGEINGIMSFAYEVTDQVIARRRAQEAEERLRLAIESAGVGTWDYYPQTKLLRCDARYKALFGISAEGPADTRVLADAIHREDVARVQEAVNRTMNPANGGHFAVQYRTIGVEDGLERWIDVRGRMIFDDTGQPQRFLGTGIEVTEQRRAIERVRFLADASEVLGASLEVRETLVRFAALAAGRIADWCSIELVGESGGLEQLTVAHADPGKVELARDLRRRYPPDPEAAFTTKVLRTKTPVMLREIPDELLVQGARDAEHLRIIREVGLRSLIMVPLLVRDEAVGVMTIAAAESRRRYGPEDLAVAEELARRAAVAIENARLYQAAQAAVAKRDEFLSIASHELKTPLASLSLYVDGSVRELRREDQPPDLAKLLVRSERARGQVKRLSHLVDELLNVSRISAGRLELVRTTMDLAELVREVVGRFVDQAAASQTPLEVETLAPVVGSWDRDRLDELFTNLVANAVKFGAGQPVHVRVERVGSRARVTVSDHGPGVRPEDRQRIFERFERTEEARNVGGMGLGLWISRQIVLAHGGTVTVEGEDGHGARFVVELP